MKQAWKASRRKRAEYDRKKGTRNDRANVFRAVPAMRVPGSHNCGCGRTISANKEKCLRCTGAAQ